VVARTEWTAGPEVVGTAGSPSFISGGTVVRGIHNVIPCSLIAILSARCAVTTLAGAVVVAVAVALVVAIGAAPSSVVAQDAPAERSAGHESLEPGNPAEQAAAAPNPPRAAIAVTQVAFQGYLTDAGGAPITGTVSLVATLYDAASGGAALWTETHPAVSVSGGVFRVALGSVAPLEVADFTGSPLYLGIAVNGETELPRTQLLASPFAIRAAEADHALTADVATDGVWSVTGGDVYRASGNVGIGTAAPARALHVEGAGSQVRVSSNVDVNTAIGSGILSIQNTTGTSGMQIDQNEIQVVGDQLYVNNDNQTATHINNLMHFNTTTGRVGINTTTPDAKVGIENQGAVDGLDLLNFSENENPEFWFESGFSGNGGTGNAIHFQSAWLTNPMTWRGDGNVGIGSVDPPHRLHVVHTTGAGLGSVAVRAEHTGAAGIALSAETNSSDATVVFEQDGTGDIVRAFRAGSLVFRVLNSGQVVTPVLQITGGADLVEGFDTEGETADGGTVLVIDDLRPGRLRASTTAYDPKVAGVVSGANGVQPGIRMGQDGLLAGETPVAMAGRVYVKCSAENGPICPGDLLTTAAIPGHAMRATDRQRANGAVIGKAMSGLQAGKGLVLALVNLQ
jgi:hypothetical protein